MKETSELSSKSYNLIDFIRKVKESNNFYLIVDELKEIITANYTSDIWKEYFEENNHSLDFSGKDANNNTFQLDLLDLKDSFRKGELNFFDCELYLQKQKLEDYNVYSDFGLELNNGNFAVILIFEERNILEKKKVTLSVREVNELMDIFEVSALLNINTEISSFYTSDQFKKYAGTDEDVNEFSFLEAIIHPADVNYAQQFFLMPGSKTEKKNAVFRIKNTVGTYHFIFCKAITFEMDGEEGQVFIFSNLRPEIKLDIPQHKNTSFFFSGIDRKVLFLKKKNIQQIEAHNNAVISDFALAVEEKAKIDSSIEQCLKLGEAECEAQLKLSDEKLQNYNLKQIRINSDSGELLGFFSLVKPLRLNRKKLIREEEVSAYQKIFNQLESSIIVTDKNGFIEILNDSSKKLFNIQTGDNFKSIYDAYESEILVQNLNSAIGNSTIENIWNYTNHTGEQVTINTKITLLELANEHQFLLLTNNDVTKQEKIKQEKFKVIKNLQSSYHKLLESENNNSTQLTHYVDNIKWLKSERSLLNAFFNSFSHAAFIIDQELSIKYYNEQANKLIMNLNGVYLGRHLKLDEYHLPCKNTYFIKYVREAFTGKKLKLISTNKIPGYKKPRTYEIVFIPMKNVGRQSHEFISCNFTDVTDSHSRQIQLNMYEDIVKNTSDGIIVTKAEPLHSPGPEIIYVNMATEKMTGYYAEELIGRSPRILQGENTDRKVLDKIKLALIKGKPVKEELINYTKAGSPYWVELSISPIYNKMGEVSCYVSHQKDITSRKEQEHERSSMIQHLLTQNEELEQFAFITSHNLRAPVARLLGLTDIINTELAKGSNPQDLFKHIATSANNLDEIIKDLNHILAYKKKIGEKKELVDFEEQLDQVKIMLDVNIKNSSARIVSDFSKCPSIFSIKSYILSILQTLIHNSIKFSKPKIEPRISLRSYTKHNNVYLEVEDNGIGFPLQVTDKTFRLYKRFHPEIPGKGINLFLIKSHIEMLKGRMEVKTEKDIGTTFKIIFPLK
ncbi:PAS domain S-box protein [Chondrinema litorale]|uniref:PAS domain S-box protein n=1 Tax=Chondrinema litorale TaxID=2994555 RepID=UPI0025432131|nr:PAS domain S-box protein [Chondrinema litorale]UZR97987.1 PAS domain S-box protein [Chondrinema litorale]